MNRLLALAKKELLQLKRDRMTLAMMIMLPVVQGAQYPDVAGELGWLAMLLGVVVVIAALRFKKKLVT